MTAVALAYLQRLADQAAAKEAEVIAQLQPIADLGRALLAVFAMQGVPPDEARRLTLAVLPVILRAGDRP